MKPKHIIISILILTLLAGGFWLYKQYPQSNVTLPHISLTDNKTLAEDDPSQLFKNQGEAPELTGITKWVNGDPVTLESLRGKVVLVNFWTYSCISCIRSLSYLNKWSVDYQDRGLVIIGVHTPAYNFEKIPVNLEAAVKRYKLTYPVAMDNNYKTWTAFHNQFWPATYLIDRNGDIIYTNLGEGNFEQTEKAVRTLLGLEGPFTLPAAPEIAKGQTPQIKLGLLQAKNFGGTETPDGTDQIYAFPSKLAKNKFALEGNWKFDQESISHTENFGRLRLKFSAAKVYLAAQSSEPQTIKIYVDGKLVKGVVVHDSDLYQLFDSDSFGEHEMEIEVPQSGFQALAFTFG